MSAVLFQLGRLAATPGALAALAAADMETLAKAEANGEYAPYVKFDTAGPLLVRHMTGDFGTLDLEDVESNMRAAKHGGRIMSEYVLPTGVKLWIITEADRSVTTLLLPDDY